MIVTANGATIACCDALFLKNGNVVARISPTNIVVSKPGSAVSFTAHKEYYFILDIDACNGYREEYLPCDNDFEES